MPGRDNVGSGDRAAWAKESKKKKKGKRRKRIGRCLGPDSVKIRWIGASERKGGGGLVKRVVFRNLDLEGEKGSFLEREFPVRLCTLTM